MWPTIRAMELTPDLLLEAKFAPARRGYDMAEVDDFLERCAEGLDILLARLKAEFERAENAEAAVVDLRRQIEAGGDATLVAPSPVAAPEPEPAPAEPEPAPAPPEPAVDEPMRILIHAERTAEAAVADARAEAQRIRAEAEAAATTQRTEAETLLATAKAEAETEARKAGEEARRAMQTEVTTLRRDRDALSDDIRNLRRWLDDQRGRMRTAARELQRLVEDPSALRELPVPDVSALSDAEGGAPSPASLDDSDDPGRTDDTGDTGDAVDLTDDASASASVSDMQGATAAPASGDDADRDQSDIFGSAGAGEPTQAVPVTRSIWPYDDDADADDAAAGPLR